MFIKFKPYRINQTPPFVNVEKVVSFGQYSSNGSSGTCLLMDNNSEILVAESPEEVAKKINDAIQQLHQAAKGGE